MIASNVANEPRRLDQEYFEWLVSQIEPPPGTPNTYLELFERMHNNEFIWMVPNDDNRVQDGLDLRVEFRNRLPRKQRRKRLIVEEVFGRGGATILEVLVALSRRVAFLAGREPPYWAWRLIENVGLSRMSDPLSDGKVHAVDDILEELVWRTYMPNGKGGFFPLKNPPEDQTRVEIWQQMSTYVLQNQPIME